MIYYKVRKKSNPELFHKGGSTTVLCWGKTGKVWTSIGSLRSFLTLNLTYQRDITEFEVIEFEVIERAIKPATDLIKPSKLVELMKR